MSATKITAKFKGVSDTGDATVDTIEAYTLCSFEAQSDSHGFTGYMLNPSALQTGTTYVFTKTSAPVKYKVPGRLAETNLQVFTPQLAN